MTAIPSPHSNMDALSSHHKTNVPCLPFSNVPFALSSDLVDRKEVAAWVRNQRATPSARAALVGCSGIGKSQLALQYAHKVRTDNPQTFVFWVDARTRARFERSYRDIASRLQVCRKRAPIRKILRTVKTWLENQANGQWTMVLDNLDDEKTLFASDYQPQQIDEHASKQMQLKTYLPQNHNGYILITTRHERIATQLEVGCDKIKHVPRMSNDEGLKLLSSTLQENAVALLRILDRIPHAVAQAAAYIRCNNTTIADYLEHISSQERTTNAADLVWQISFERIQQDRKSAADLLLLMSHFSPQDVPETILRTCGEHVTGQTTTVRGRYTRTAFDEDLETLQAYSLVSPRTRTGTYDIHNRVQLCTQEFLLVCGDDKRWELIFLSLLAREQPNGEWENWAKCELLLPYVETVLVREPESEGAIQLWAQLLTNAAWYLWKQGKYNAAENLLKKANTAKERALGMNDKYSVISSGILAQVYRAQGRYEEAETCNQEAAALHTQVLGSDYTNASTRDSNKALIFHYLGKYEDAEQLNKQVLEWRKQRLGEDHPDTITSVSNLAGTLHCQGKYEKAKILSREALESRRRVLGSEHPNTMISRSNLALVHHYLGEYNESEELDRQVLNWRKEELGEDHPDTITSVSNLAGTLYCQGEYKEAELLSREALTSRKQVLGELHPDTLKSMANLALVLQCQGQYEETDALHRKALALREEQLGPHHPDTLTSVYCLAYLLHKRQKYGEAGGLYRRAVYGREKALGRFHPCTLACSKHYKAMCKEAELTR